MLPLHFVMLLSCQALVYGHTELINGWCIGINLCMNWRIHWQLSDLLVGWLVQWDVSSNRVVPLSNSLVVLDCTVTVTSSTCIVKINLLSFVLLLTVSFICRLTSETLAWRCPIPIQVQAVCIAELKPKFWRTLMITILCAHYVGIWECWVLTRLYFWIRTSLL